MNQTTLDFLKNNYFVIVYGITWLISAVTYKKYFDTLLKYFPIIIAYTFFTELLGGIIRLNEDFQLIAGYKNHNHIIYNIYHVCFFLFFFYVYWKIIDNKKQKKVIKYGASLFILINLINLIFQNPLILALVYAYLFGMIFLILCIVLYFKQTFKTYTFSLIKYNLLFWVSLGLLVFHSIYLPLKILREFYPEYYYMQFRDFHLSMIILMYVLFSIGFILCKRKAFH